MTVYLSVRRAIVGEVEFEYTVIAEAVGAERGLAGAQVHADDELLREAQRRHRLSRQLHLHDGECHATAGVDDELRVHGLAGLRIIDASVPPAVTSINTKAPTIMIAEKGAARERLAAHPRAG